jgi:hypothetical protein
MFEGTDLSLAFGGLSGDSNSGGYGNYESGNSYGSNGGGMYDTPTPSGMMQTPSGPKMLPSAPPPAPMPELTVSKSDKMYSQNDYYNDTPVQSKPRPKVVPANTFWERVGNKKMEVAKVVILSLIIVLAFSLDHLILHYLNNFFGQSFLTETQEFIIRLAYPVTIIIIIWLLKSL